MKIAVLLLAILFIMPGASALHAEIYYWVDEKGVKRYSNNPPPSNIEVKVMFKEYEFDEAADQKRTQSDEKEMQALIKEIEAEERQTRAQQKIKENEAKAEKAPSKEELIEAEKKRLLDKIAMLEAQPLSYFGSQRNKIVRIGFYKYRFETLMQDPDKYLKEPASFEGNVKYSDYY